MQNSGEGNIINLVASLLNDKVYGIPVIFIVGWRGEPGVHDEPQHIFQGEVTLKLLEDMDNSAFVISRDTSEDEVAAKMQAYRQLLAEGKQVTFIICKDALQYDRTVKYVNDATMLREEIIRQIVQVSGDDLIVSTTGKASRELYEIREANVQGHKHDFLTVGSMGHSSSIALGIAVQKPKKRIWCIDGDGAVLMHVGAMALIGATKPKNLIHIVINNGAHETVGGMPTAAGCIDMAGIAIACGYPVAVRVSDMVQLEQALHEAKRANMLEFIEIACAIDSRKDLGRPKASPKENKEGFMSCFFET